MAEWLRARERGRRSAEASQPHFIPLDWEEFHTSSPSFSITRLPSSRRYMRHILKPSVLWVLVCQMALSSRLYMTKLQSSCMQRRWASRWPVVSDDHIGLQPWITKLPSSCMTKRRRKCFQMSNPYTQDTVYLKGESWGKYLKDCLVVLVV